VRYWAVILLAFGLFPGCGETTSGGSSSGGISKPRFFIADSLGSACTVDERGRGRSASAAKAALDRLYSNSERYIADLRRSTGLTAYHDAYTANWDPILFNSYAAAAAGDQALAATIIAGLAQLARGGRYLNEPGLITRSQALSGPSCYSQGPNTPCPSHTPRFVARMYTNLLISAAVLEPYMNEQDRATIMPWFDAGYKKFVLPELNSDQDGLYDFANNGMARLAYAALKNDMGLASRELSARRRDFVKHIEPSGYIQNNSYRGVRGFWYHTYGLDPALSYALVAREWGVDYFRDADLRARMTAALQKTSLGITDYAAFRSVGNRGDSYSTNPADTKDHVHQFALNIYAISSREFGIRLPADRKFQELSRLESYSTISGLSARCYYSGR